MSLYITVDGGTTNTRINIVQNNKIVDSVKLPIGARMGIKQKDLMKTEMKKALEKLFTVNSIDEKDITCILASGMITSEFGLCHLEHIKTPAGIVELHHTMYQTVLKEITEVPFVFIRGVKMNADSFEDTDIMRGEETELMGMLQSDYGKCVYVLPGSHSKIIRTDEVGRICDFSTMLTGEMIVALSEHTILKDAVDLKVSEIDDVYLLKGYDYCKCVGINKALFKTRILKNAFQCNPEQTYSFFLGAVLCNEIGQIINSDAQTVVIGGKSQIKNAMAIILKNRDHKKVVALDENLVNFSTSLGAIRIFEHQ